MVDIYYQCPPWTVIFLFSFFFFFLKADLREDEKNFYIITKEVELILKKALANACQSVLKIVFIFYGVENF